MKLKPTSSFKFPKQYKCMIALMNKTDEQRHSHKRAMIQAILYAQDQERRVGKGDKATQHDD